MSKRDYYEVLDVSRNVSDKDLKKAFRRLAMKYHPDRNPDDASVEEKFKEAKEAYEILSDPQKRTAYDQFGHAGVDPTMGAGGGAGGGGFGDIFEDMFGDVFGGGGRSGGGHGQRVHRGADMRYEMELSLEEAVFGVAKEIRVPTKVACNTCSGSGAKKGSQPKACTTCGGVGQVRVQQGFFAVQQACPHCHGQGSVIANPCGDCRGSGLKDKTKTLSVKIPAGVDDGDRIRLSGEGQAGEKGGTPGDLYVQVRLKKHPIFKRDESDLHCEVPISFAKAALGGEIEAPTLTGKVKIKVASETQTGKLFRLRGKGVKSVHGGGIGDLYCRLVVETPVKLTSEQKKILRELDESTHGAAHKHVPKSNSWVDKVKDFFDNIKV